MPAAARGRLARRGPTRARVAVAALTAALIVVVTALLVAAPRGGTRPAGPAAAAGLLASTSSWSLVTGLHAGGASGAPGGAPLELDSIACTSTPGACVAVGGASVARSQPDGRWVVQSAPLGTGFLTSVACSGAHCVAVAQPAGGPAGDLVITTSDAGSTWTARHVPANVGGLSAVSCSTALRCAAVGESRSGGIALVTVDGGTTWRLVAAPASLAGLNGVGCAPAAGATCVAVGWFRGRGGAAIAILRDGGAQWSVVPAPAGVGGLGAVDCPTAAVCYAAGFLSPRKGTSARFPGAVVVTTDAGRHWALLAVPAAAGPVNALSCPAPSSCVAAGVSARPTAGPSSPQAAGPPGMAVSTVDGGLHWQVDVLPRPASGVAGVSCGADRASPACTAVAAGPASSTLVLAG
jgi:hypothetical protein